MADVQGRDRIALLAAAALLLGAGLSSIDFWAPDEPRYGQIAEEIRSFDHGLQGLVLLHLGGEPYTQKPPLYYWLAAGIGSISGHVTETAARLPSVLAGIATVALTFAFGRRLFPGRTAPLVAGLVLLTSFRFAHLARRAQLDVLLTACEVLALFAFWRIESTRDDAAADGPVDARLVALLHAALGAAALTKGPVGWLPLLVIAAYLAWEGRLGSLRRIVPAWALLLSVAPVCIWIAAATSLAPSGFFEEAVVANVWGRFVEASSHMRPIYYYLYQLPADFMPWTLLLPLVPFFLWQRARDAGSLPPAWRLLVVWVVVPLVLFSLSSGKRGLYLLPVFPALALMLGGAVDGWLRRYATLPALVSRGSLALGVALAGTAGTVAATGGIETSAFPGFGVSAGTAATVACITTVGILAGVLVSRSRGDAGTDPSAKPLAPLLAAAATVFALELFVFTAVYPDFDEQKSPRPVALLAAGLTEPGEAVGIFDDEGLAGGILYYGDREAAILPRPAQVADFFAEGGRYVVLERWKLPWLDPVGRFRVHARTRRDARELAIVSLEDDSQKSR